MSASNLTPATHTTPVRPAFPPSRMLYEWGIFGVRHFASEEAFDAWKKEPLWRRLLGMTAHNRPVNTP